MKPKVLVVDDEPDFVELTEYHLAGQGYDVFSASSGVEALHQARRLLPDVILLDLMLPDLDGASVFEILRLQPSTASVPIVIVSALDGMMIRGKKVEKGVWSFFKKPVDLKALVECVRGVLEQQREVLRLADEEEQEQREPK